MGVLRSVLDEYAGFDPGVLGDAELGVELVEVRRAIDILEGHFLGLVAEADRRQTYEASGAVNITQFVSHFGDMSGSAAYRSVKTARALLEMPIAFTRVLEGELSGSKVGVLAGCLSVDPVAFAHDEAQLVRAAQENTFSDFVVLADYWRNSHQTMWDHQEMADRVNLRTTKTSDGMILIQARLHPEAGTTVTAAIDHAVRAQGYTGEGEGARRAEALTRVCARYLDITESGNRRVRPHINVIVDLATLENRAGHTCRMDAYGSISPGAARRLACDAEITRVITGPASQPLDVGRTTRVVTPAIRNALVARDQRCRFHTCDRPADWCDAHHITHWADGGETKLDNLVLLCRRHHGMVHESEWRIHGPAHNPIFLSPGLSPPPDDG